MIYLYITLQVCQHGVVSFGKRDSKSTQPRKTKHLNKYKLRRAIVAPFRANFNTSSIKVWYRYLDVLNSYDNMTKRATEVRHVENTVKKFGELSSFEASFILIATWENVLPNDTDIDAEESEVIFILLICKKWCAIWSMHVSFVTDL